MKKNGFPDTANAPPLKKKWPKRLAIGLIIALAIIVVFILAMPMILATISQLSGGQSTPPRACCELSVGIAPVDSKTVELLSEQVTFISYTPEEFEANNYDLNMEYRVKTTQKNARFVYPILSDDAVVSVDGKPVEPDLIHNYAVTTHRPYSFGRLSFLKSVGTTLNDYYNMGYGAQMPDTYELLTRALIDHPDYDSYKITLGTKFAVYDVSGAPLRSKDAWIKPVSFTVKGSLDQPRFLLADSYKGDQFHTLFDQTVKEKEDTSVVRYTLFEPSKGDSPKTKWLVVPADSDDLQVKIGFKTVPKQIKTLGEILTQNPGLPEDARQNYVDVFKWYLAGAPKDGSIQVFDSNLAEAQTGSDLALFTIDKPGEHVISIKTKAVGNKSPYTWMTKITHQIQWADSPAKLWLKTGPRKLTVDTGEGVFTNDIPDTVFDFYKEVDRPVSSLAPSSSKTED